MSVYFRYSRDISRRYSIGKTLEEIGVKYLYKRGPDGRFKLIPALRKMFFNQMVITQHESQYTFSDSRFVHADFVKLNNFACVHPAELDEMMSSESDSYALFKYTQQSPKHCGFTGDMTRMYREGGDNTYYLYKGELRTAKFMIISRHITRNMKKCRHCLKYVIEHYQGMKYDEDGNGYCVECESILNSCTGCGRITGREKCGECADFYSQINDYGKKPAKWWFFNRIKNKLVKCESEESGISPRVKQLYLGDEHEVENDSREDVYTNAHRVTDDYSDELFYTTEDSSVRRGFEMHTHPSTHKVHKSRNWDGIAYLRKNGGKSYDTETAGLHFHLNRNAFTTWHFLKFIKFLMDNISLTLAIGRRKNIHNMNEYASFNFGFFHNVKRKVVSDLRNRRNKINPTTTYGHRGAINLQNRETIELRFMGGSLDEQKYKAKIDFIQALYEYTSQSGFESQSVREFCEYVRKRKNRFRNLITEMKTDVFKRAVKFPKETPENLTY